MRNAGLFKSHLGFLAARACRAIRNCQRAIIDDGKPSPLPQFETRFDQVINLRFNLPAHLIEWLISSGIRRFHKIRRDPRTPV